MNHKRRVYVVASFIAIFGLAQEPAKPAQGDPMTTTWSTNGEWNGRFWKTLTRDERSIFLLGYCAAVERVTIVVSDNFERHKEMSKDFWAVGLTIEEVRSAVDKFYESSENGPISIPSALYVVSKRADGADEESIQKIISGLRARAHRN